MTTEKMPDVQIPNVFYLSWDSENDIKLYRAKIVEELLKQARNVLNSANNTYLGSEYIYTLKPDDVENTINAIDKFLGEK